VYRRGSAVETRLFHSHVGEKDLLVFVRQIRDLSFEGGG